ncbi:MAG: TraR/DksA C4-type zinc finger protein [Acidimicrobiia bacterium]|nr:MAG: TraR/DksA C4-type zinc finger protein [Acidimicrobiia bacterium]
MTAINESARQRLSEDRLQLIHQLEELGANEGGDLRDDVDFGEGFADAAAATAERTEVLGLIESLRQSVEEIDRALKRIEDGSYGTCIACGKPISAARLEHRPESIHCVDCKAAKGT